MGIYKKIVNGAIDICVKNNNFLYIFELSFRNNICITKIIENKKVKTINIINRIIVNL